jgi:hypothetical protein
MKLGLTTLAIAILLASCKSADPTVEIISASPDALDPSKDGQNDLTIKARYTDGNGDLGGGSALVYDCRAEGIVTELALPPIASKQALDASVAIEGELDLVVRNVGFVTASPKAASKCAALGVGAPQAGAQSFCVVLVDAADNASAGACTSPIKVADPAN